jgi:predicted PurR-regulated permease PerM
MRGDRHVWFWAAALAVAVLLVALLRNVLLPFVAGAALAYFLNPVADRLERTGIGRTAAAALIVGLAGLLLLLAVVFLVPLAVGQLSQLAGTLPGDLERIKLSLEAWAEQRLGARFPTLKAGIERAFADIAAGSAGLYGQVAQGLWNRGLALFNLAALLLVTPIVVFYLLRDWHPMLARIDSWLPRDHQATVRRIAADIDGAVSAFIRGQGTLCLVLANLYALALSLVGLRYGLVIGLATGLLAFVPFVGWALGLAAASLVAISQTWPDTTLVLKVAGIYAAGMALDSAFLSPNIVGQRIGLHPVWLIFALFVFGALFGFLGALVAVPVAAALAVIVRFARDRYLASSIYLGSGTGPGRTGPEA